LQVALAQLSPRPGDWASNCERLSEVVATCPDAEIAVFPELFLSGYSAGHAIELACSPSGPELEPVRRAAAESSTAIVVGFPERIDARQVTDSAACFDPTGRLAAVYRKTHLFGAERDTFMAGNSLLVLGLIGRRLAPLICFDVEFPEPARSCALAGANLLVTISANMEPYLTSQRIAAQARALENELLHLYVNRCGSEENLRFVGGTCAIGSDGAVIAEATGADEEVLCVDVPVRESGAGYFDYLRLRRDPLRVIREP
jgi:predicted amidohydrolase